jgi:hypothetical protein
MRGISVIAVALAVAIGVAQSQQPGGTSKPGGGGSVEDLLARALSHNADVLAAESKVREAEAELRRVKRVVVNNVLAARAKVESAKKVVTVAADELNMQERLKKSSATTDTDYRRAAAQVEQAQMALAEVQATVNALTGASIEEYSVRLGLSEPSSHRGPGTIGGGAGVGTGGPPIPEPDLPPRHAPEGPMADKIRKALDAPTKGHDFDGIPLADVLKFYRDLSNQVPVVASLGDLGSNPIKLSLNKEVPLGAHFQALQDMAPGLKIYVRDYGFFCTFDNSPEDGMPFLEFWHPKNGG